MIRRFIEHRINRALADTPVVLLTGARQTGKTTLVRFLAKKLPGCGYYSFDDAAILAAASADPSGFIQSLPNPAVIDEAHRIPGIFTSIKREVDRDRASGRFILTGSANPMFMPAIADSLAGRMEMVTLWPFSRGEMEGRVSLFIDRAFYPIKFQAGEAEIAREPLERLLVAGGFPEAASRRDEERRNAWFGSYVNALLQKDLRDLAQIEGLTRIPQLLSLLASRTAGIFNLADISRGLGIPHTTATRYMALLEALYLVWRIPPWFVNRGKRLVKSPKLHLCDMGLAAYLTGASVTSLKKDRLALGRLFETFVAGELVKQIAWSERSASLYHYRTAGGAEVDLVLEDRAGRVVGVEVKASADLKNGDFSGLASLKETAGRRFTAGYVIYTGEKRLPFGRDFWAVPVQELWS
jgi:predicted AAA+ superfamily ATPase